MRCPALGLPSLVCFIIFASALEAHDIPNARVDRATQVIIEPGLLKIDYEVGLSELTLTQELRSLIGKLPGASTDDWFRAYGDETGILNARGFLIDIDGAPIDLAVSGFDLAVEAHPKYTFHFRATIPRSGRISIHDTNFVTSQGYSRLAAKGIGSTIQGDDLPADISAIVETPLWRMTDEEEARSRAVTLIYETNPILSLPAISPAADPKVKSPQNPQTADFSLTRLLNQTNPRALVVLAAMAFLLGAIHALQPGHGKTLVAASSLQGTSILGRGTVVALVATITHSSSVMLIAALLWFSGTSRFSEIHLLLVRSAGFVIAAIGIWRLGRIFARHDTTLDTVSPPTTNQSAIGLGLAAGIVPCWDAVALLTLAGALGRLPLGLFLAVVFSLGMGTVLVALSWLTGRVRRFFSGFDTRFRFEFWSGLASGLVLSGLGVYLLGFAV